MSDDDLTVSVQDTSDRRAVVQLAGVLDLNTVTALHSALIDQCPDRPGPTRTWSWTWPRSASATPPA
jgi:hypothetical protein